MNPSFFKAARGFCPFEVFGSVISEGIVIILMPRDTTMVRCPPLLLICVPAVSGELEMIFPLGTVSLYA